MAPRRSATETIGHRFAGALAAKDAVALKALLAPEVDFHAMTPGRAWEGDDPATIVDDIILGRWFAPDRRIVDTLSVEADSIGPVQRVAYRLWVSRPEGEFVVEQQAYLRCSDADDTISWLRIMCTGFVPGDEA